jgi:hypothetical protein
VGYLTELTGLRDHLKSKLSASGQDSTEDRGPTTGELAERIKALKAAITIEGTQQRTERKHSTAEEPITARIRRRQDAESFNEEAGHPQAASHEPETKSFRERICGSASRNPKIKGKVRRSGHQRKNPRSESTSGSGE